MRESKSAKIRRKHEARKQRDRELGVERKEHLYECLVWDTGGGVCSCGETERRANERAKRRRLEREENVIIVRQ